MFRPMSSHLQLDYKQMRRVKYNFTEMKMKRGEVVAQDSTSK